MSDLFPIYEDSFNIILKKVMNSIDSFHIVASDKQELVLKEAENYLKESERIVEFINDS